MLKLEKLQVSIDGQPILHGVDLEIRAGETHALMGPNGSGKSTLASVLAGRPEYQITDGRMLLDGTDLSGLSPEERAHRGIFLGFQYPVEIPGLTNMYFLRAAVNAVRKARGQAELDPAEFIELAREQSRLLGLDDSLAYRGVNLGFSGGEKKRNEILQMVLLEPRLSILDETDSGLDIDALKTVAAGIRQQRRPDRSILLITHYQRILKYVQPDRVHVMLGGRVVRSGDHTLAAELERHGYSASEMNHGSAENARAP